VREQSRQLQIGWAMYKDDANDVLIPNSPGNLFAGDLDQRLRGGLGFHTGQYQQAVLPGSAVFTDGAVSGQSAWGLPLPGDKSAFGERQRIRSYSMNSQMEPSAVS